MSVDLSKLLHSEMCGVCIFWDQGVNLVSTAYLQAASVVTLHPLVFDSRAPCSVSTGCPFPALQPPPPPPLLCVP